MYNIYIYLYVYVCIYARNNASAALRKVRQRQCRYENGLSPR